jgi:hypothetical protein
VKHDVLAVFQQLNDLRGRGFYKLNQALLTLLPKRSGVSAITAPLARCTSLARSRWRCSCYAWRPSWIASSVRAKMLSSEGAFSMTTLSSSDSPCASCTNCARWECY